MSLRIILLILFVTEVSLLIVIGGKIGLVSTFLEFIGTAVIGSYMLRKQGVHMLIQVNKDIQKGISPEAGLMSVFLTIVGGILLIIPGFATDLLGVLLLIPFIKSRTLDKVHQSLSRRAEKNRKHTPIIINQSD